MIIDEIICYLFLVIFQRALDFFPTFFQQGKISRVIFCGEYLNYEIISKVTNLDCKELKTNQNFNRTSNRNLQYVNSCPAFFLVCFCQLLTKKMRKLFIYKWGSPLTDFTIFIGRKFQIKEISVFETLSYHIEKRLPLKFFEFYQFEVGCDYMKFTFI